MDDDLLDDGQAELEARFRELEREEEIRRMRGGGAPRPTGDATGGSPGDDELADIKAALDDERPLERHVIVLCQGCGAKNRTSLTRLRGGDPRCGGCKADLSFT